MVNKNWDLAGLSDELSRLGKRVGGGSILVPSRIDLDLTTNELVWSFRGPGRPSIIEPEPQILDHFVQLWRGKPKAILRFARSWGALYCGSESHSRNLALRLNTRRYFPVTPAEKILLQNFREKRELSDLGIDPQFEYREPLSLWRYFSHRANAALNIASALHQKRVGAIEDWECFWGVCKHADDFKDYEPMSQIDLHAYVEEQRIFHCQR
jgi:hypothetical protein